MADLKTNSNELQEVLNILANKVDSSTLQPKVDPSLETNDITVVGAINEHNLLLRGEQVDTWMFNDYIDFSGSVQFNVDISYQHTDGTTYTHSSIGFENNETSSWSTMVFYGSDTTYQDCWYAGCYRTIKLIGGEDINNPELLAILEANAVKISVASSELNTNCKNVIGAINEVNSKTIDKIMNFDTAKNGAEGVYIGNTGRGISWYGTFDIYGSGADPFSGSISHTVPIVAGENVEFEVDEGNQVVKINATGGGGNENVMSKFTLPTEASTTVVDMINAIQNAGGSTSEWNIINLTGHTSTTFGLIANNYGGTVYNIQGTNLVNMTVISNTRDWSGVTIGAFTTMFRPVLPSCDESNEGQFLSVVNGTPTWTSVATAAINYDEETQTLSITTEGE
jgi:hypothetical protein